ncbi:ChaC-like protein [Mrakia frigida]|uniref:gamma-glutamylcyclotransferase n=1 Tax=Mrakia frigida TaxID=29902 RepID=UPI003FCC1ABA
MTFIVFGYGSLVWKPPPHTVSKTTGYVKGFVRRFAQSSNDHRGTPERTGRVVTLVRAEDWTSMTSEPTNGQEEKVWGVGWTIDPEKEESVRADLDYREKNGYSVQSVDIYNVVDGVETIVVHQATIYVGEKTNEAFIGAEPIPTLSARIHSCIGPSGLNKDYLYNLAIAVRELDPETKDDYLFDLEIAVRALDALELISRSGKLLADS